MALVRSLALRKVLPSKPLMLYNSAKQASYYMEDYIPGEYPKTEKERLEAAKKYGLLPHEYEPYPDDGLNGKGDYPKLPLVAAEQKDPYYPWDLPESKMNYGEVWHAHWDMYTEDRCDSKRYRQPPWLMITSCVGIIVLLHCMMFGIDQYRLHRPVCQKQYPHRGKVHYSFERGQ